MKYYYISYIATAKSGKQDNLICEAVKKGNISDIILELKKVQSEDQYYHAYMVTFFAEISEEDFNKLNGNIG